MWVIGEWWNFGERYGKRVAIVTGEDGTGPTYGSCRVAGTVAKRWPVLNVNTLSFKHHAIVAALPDEQAIPLLQWFGETPEPRLALELAARVKQVRRSDNEGALAGRIAAASQQVGIQLYGVIYADPPWRFEPYSRESGIRLVLLVSIPGQDMDAIALHSIEKNGVLRFFYFRVRRHASGFVQYAQQMTTHESARLYVEYYIRESYKLEPPSRCYPTLHGLTNPTCKFNEQVFSHFWSVQVLD